MIINSLKCAELRSKSGSKYRKLVEIINAVRGFEWGIRIYFDAHYISMTYISICFQDMLIKVTPLFLR